MPFVDEVLADHRRGLPPLWKLVPSNLLISFNIEK